MKVVIGFRFSLRSWVAAVALAALCGAVAAAPAVAGTATEIGTLPTLDALNRAESPLSNGGKWSAVAWSGGATPAGSDTTTGWQPQAFPTVTGAYWNPTTFSTAGAGDAAALTLQTSPGIAERYVSIWLNMPSPGTLKSGYQLSWTLDGAGTYAVALSKWSEGTRTVLASKSAVSIPAGTTMAISDVGGTLTVWETVSGALTSILSAEDSTFATGYAGIEGTGNISRSLNFRAGALLGGSITGVAVLDNLEREELPLATGKWSKASWAGEIGGAWNCCGYRGFGSNSATVITTAYWNPTTFSDSGQGDLVAATVGSGSAWGSEYLALWLNMPSPGSARSGYEARFAGVTGSSSNYNVELSKWVSGTRTVLASASTFSLPVGTTIALTEVSGALTLWTGTTSFSPALTVADSTYSSGYAGLEVYGVGGTEYNFRAGTPAIGVPPSKPTLTSVVPASPANNNTPSLIGSATAGSTVQLFTNSSCSGSPVASGSAAAFGSTGIAASVADNTTTTFYAKATNGAGASPCSTTSVTYVEDSIAPAVPTVSSTNPASGSNNNSPKVIGSAESGSTVKLYTNATCTSAVAATGSAATFASPGLTASVADNTTTTFYATASDTAGNASACSSTSVTYVEATPKVYWGAWLGGNAYSTPEKTYGDGPWDSETWNLFEKHAGKKISIEHFGQPAPWNQAFAEGPLNLTRERGAIPLMDMDPDGVTLKEIVEGKKDSYFVTWAKAVKAWAHPMFLRWTWEMNGTWFQWGAEAAANPTLYKEAWWHLHNIVEEQGASNVTWVWCPNLSFAGSTSLSSLYPAKESEGKGKYVDWTCLDGYNFGTNPAQPDSWKSFSTLYTASYNELLALAPTKPIMIGEMSSTEYGGSKASWITDAIGTQIPKNFPKIKAVVWYNKWDGGRDWPIETSSSSESAFAGAIASTYYAGNTFGSLPALTKVEPLP